MHMVNVFFCIRKWANVLHEIFYVEITNGQDGNMCIFFSSSLRVYVQGIDEIQELPQNNFKLSFKWISSHKCRPNIYVTIFYRWSMNGYTAITFRHINNRDCLLQSFYIAINIILQAVFFYNSDKPYDPKLQIVAFIGWLFIYFLCFFILYDIQ